jgi:hypothetical protein
MREMRKSLQADSQLRAAAVRSWEAGSWGQGQFENPEEGERLLLEAAAK